MNDPFVLMLSVADSHEVHGVKDFTASHAVDNPASGRVMEKCGLKFESFSEHSKRDGSVTYKVKNYRMHIWGRLIFFVHLHISFYSSILPPYFVI